jgi:hypothetical protein
MNPKKFASVFALFLIISILSINNSCSERNETVSCFPNSIISVTINLNSAHYFKLQNVGGWVYTLGEVGTGTNGLIIYRATSGFMIYDRNAPHLCPDQEKTILEVDNGGTFVSCPKDRAKWALFNGQRQQGEVVPSADLKTYRNYYFNPSTNTLLIYNN